MTTESKNRNKKVRLCVMVITACLVLTSLWAVLAIPKTALAKKPGDAGVAPVCVEFRDYTGDGVQSDNGTAYCDDKQLKVEAIMTQDGHVNLQPNTSRGKGRILRVYTDLDPINPLDGWRFLVGGWNDNFDMRNMAIGETRNNVNLRICTYTPDENARWRLIFNPDSEAWIDPVLYQNSTFINVTRMGTYTWEVEVDDTDQAVLVIQTQTKNKSVFTYGGVVVVPSFTVTVTLVP